MKTNLTEGSIRITPLPELAVQSYFTTEFLSQKYSVSIVLVKLMQKVFLGIILSPNLYHSPSPFSCYALLPIFLHISIDVFIYSFHS